MRITLFTANCVGQAANCSYPNQADVSTEPELLAAVAKDHVCAEYKGNYRNVDNFIRSNVIVMDIDNDHSEIEDEWITAEKLDAMFPDVDYMLAASRHHMLPKDGKSARPRYHIYFPIEECTSAVLYADMKKALQAQFTFFDDNALDAARFIFGANCSEVVVHNGWLTVDEQFNLLEDVPEDDFDGISSSGPIMEGSRNKTMSLFAGKVLKRYGNADGKAREVFDEHAKKCDPPLDKEELDTIWNSAVRFFNKKVVTQDGYIPPDKYNDEFGAASLKPDDFSDIGEAKILAREYGEELKYTSATDYLRFDGECWREDKQMAVGAAEEFLDLQLADAQDAVKSAIDALIGAGVAEDTVRGGGKELEKACVTEELMKMLTRLLSAQSYLKFVMKCRNYKNLVNVQNAAKPMLSIKVSDLDCDPFLINTPYATYDMSKGLAGEQPHDPHDLITKITECSPGTDGKALWEEALNTFFCGDQELIDYVQMTVGVAAVGKVYQEHMIIAYGGGANGKSTFWNTIYRVMGDYAGKISAEALTMNCKRNVKPEMAELKGKRLIIASEMEEGMRLNTATVKQLCSTDEIQAEKKYKDPFAFVPSHTLVLYTNHLPKVGANDDGIWRRLVVIPFNAKITGKSDVKNFADHLYAKAGGYIMSWIIEGAKKAIAADFKIAEPKVVVDAIQAYREDNDWLGQFIDECCELDPSYQEKSGDVYQAYRAYCMTNGEYIRSTTDFYSAMEKAGINRRRTNKANVVVGLKLCEGQDFLQ